MIRIAVRLLMLPHRRRRLEWPCALAAAILLLHVNLGDQAAHGQCQYEIIGEIKGPDCGIFGVPQTRARGMNNHGHVVGDRNDCVELHNKTYAFVWKPETGMVELPTPANVHDVVWAYDINDDGYVVGEHDLLDGGIRAFVWNPNTEQYTYLDPVDPNWGHSHVRSINNDGIASGRRVITPQGVSPAVYSAFLWNVHTGEVIDLGVPHGLTSTANTIHGDGDAAGWSGSHQAMSPNNSAVGWFQGKATILNMPSPSVASFALDLNIGDQIVGQFKPDRLPWRGFLWSGGVTTELTPPLPFNFLGPRSIADSGQIVGDVTKPVVLGIDPALLQRGDFYLITDHIVSIPPTISSINGASVINNYGMILAEAVFFGAGKQAILLQPANVPAGDLDFDCDVGVPDLLILLKQFFTAGGIPSADFNGDGVVNVADLILLLQNWGPQ